MEIMFLIFLIFSVMFGTLPESQGTTETCSQCTDKVLPLSPPCENWNATILVHPRSLQKQIAVSFNVCCMYMPCFKNFEMLLFQPEKNDCNVGIVLDFKTFQNNIYGNFISFNNLGPGPYCVKIIPADKVCADTNICTILNSNIEHLSGAVAISSTIMALAIESQEPMKVMFILTSSAVLLVIVILIAAILAWKRRICSSRGTGEYPIDPAVSERPEVLKEILPKASNCIILHRPNRKAEARALCNVLNECMGHNAKCLDDYLHMLIIDDIPCVSDLVSYSCTKNGINNVRNIFVEKKIIILESERTLDPQTLKELKNIDKRMDDIFNLSISLLYANEYKCLKDYCHIFVVRFNQLSTTDDAIKEIICARRYVLPEHLVELYFDLHDISLKQIEKEYFSKSLLSSWEQKSSYVQFLNSLS